MKLPVKQKTQFSLIYLLIAVLVLSLVQSWLLAPRTVEIPMSKFLALVREGKVERVSVTDREIRGTLKPGALPAPQPGPGDKVRSLVGADQPATTFTTTRIPGIEDSALVKELEQNKIEFSGRVESTFWRDFIFGWIVPLGLMVGLWMFVMRRMGGGPTQALSFGRSKAKI
jgi:cell division protease FtsH